MEKCIFSYEHSNVYVDHDRQEEKEMFCEY